MAQRRPAPVFGHAAEAFVIAHVTPGAWTGGTAEKYRQTLSALEARLAESGLGFFDGVGVGNADEIVMPLTPHHVAVLGQGSESRDAAPGEADRYNTLQVRIAQHHVHFRIGSNLASFVRSLPGSEAAA